jgi:hypothetical protein
VEDSHQVWFVLEPIEGISHIVSFLNGEPLLTVLNVITGFVSPLAAPKMVVGIP